MGPAALALWAALACSNDDYDEDGFVEPADCDDGDPNTHPGAEEVAYDRVDQDCDGGDLVDRDRDGFVADQADGPDCDDLDPTAHPGAFDEPYDGRDADCDEWSDYDFDHDGFAAMGHGGDDCDDDDPRLVPIDSDGDGASPCTGDCDESDPARNEGAEPVCGNGVDDDCDGVSDCTPVGIGSVEGLDRIAATEAVVEFGALLEPLGDVDGDGAEEVVATAIRVADGDSLALVLTIQPFAAGSDETTAWASVRAATHTKVGSPGDVDGDGRPDLWVAEDAVVLSPHLMVFAPVEPGEHDVDDARLDLVGEAGSDVGHAVVRVDDRLVVGAPGQASVQLLDADSVGTRPFGEDGSRIDGTGSDGLGSAIAAEDLDGDGVSDLLIAAPGFGLGSASWVYQLPLPPRSGSTPIDDQATAWVEVDDWSPSSIVLRAGDLDGDGALDAVIGAPYQDTAVGAVAVALDRLEGTIEVDDLPVVRLGLGDDTFGLDVEPVDFDGDGFDDLIVGAPAVLGASGGLDKPGAVYVWYGPLEPSVEHTFEADLFLQGAYNGYRAHTGEALALLDADLDGGVDLLIASPLYDHGVIDLLPGGFTGLYGE